MRRLGAVTAMVVVAVVGALGVVAAQEATPGGDGVVVEPLFSTVLEGMPPAPAPAAVARITFEPGAGLSMNANPGPALHFVEEGGFTVLMAGDATLADGVGGAATPVTTGVEFEIRPGDLLTIPANTPFEVFNTGTAPAVAIIVEYFARAPGGTFPPGIALAPLVVGELAAPPADPVALALDRVTIGPGGSIPAVEEAGGVLVSVEEGSAAYTLGEGGMVVRAAGPGAAAAATPGVEEALGRGDGVIDRRGSLGGVRNAGDGPLVLLVLSHRPAGDGGTPGA